MMALKSEEEVPLVLRLPNAQLVDALCYVDAKSDSVQEQAKEAIEAELKVIIKELEDKHKTKADTQEMKNALLQKHYLPASFLDKENYQESPFLSVQELPNRKLGKKWELASLDYDDVLQPLPATASLEERLAQLSRLGGYAHMIQCATINLELAEQLSKDQYVIHMQQVEKFSSMAVEEARAMKQKVEEINKKRKTLQVEAGNELRYLQKEEKIEEQNKLHLVGSLTALITECENLYEQCQTRGLTIDGTADLDAILDMKEMD